VANYTQVVDAVTKQLARVSPCQRCNP
jgi:hypothetical protein